MIDQSAVWAEARRDEYFLEMKATTEQMLRENWSWVEAVGNALLTFKHLDHAQITKLKP